MTAPGDDHPLTVLDLGVEELLGPAPEPYFAVAHDWTVRYVNPAAEPLLGRRAEDLVGRSLWDEFPEAATSPFGMHYRRTLATGEPSSFTEYYPPLGRWFSVHAVPQRAGLSVFFHDVSALKRSEQAAERTALLHAGLGAVASAVAEDAAPERIFDLVCRHSAQLVDASGAWLARFAEDAYEVVGSTEPPASRRPGVGERLTVLAGSEVAQLREGEGIAVAADAGGRFGGFGLSSVVLHPIRVAGAVWGGLAVAWEAPNPAAGEAMPLVREFADLVAVALGNAAARSELTRQATTDPLTGLANLRTLQAELDRRIAAAGSGGDPLALALVDVDDFKSVNDGLGHEAGDRVLRRVADALGAACGPGDLAARIGGDEFALVLARDGADALDAAERVRREVERSGAAAGEFPVTASIGVSSLEPGLDRDELQRRADDAMYWAKLHGRNSAWAYDAGLMEHGMSAGGRAAALRRTRAVLDPLASEAGRRDGRTFWQTAIDALSKEVAVVDDGGRIVATNAAWRAFAAENGGTPEATGIGADYLAVCEVAGDPVARAVAEGVRGLLAGTEERFELDYPCHGPGRERWFTLRAARLGGSDQRRVIITHQDITERRRAEEQVAFQVRLLDVITVPVFAHDADGRIVYWNRAHEELRGLTLDEVRGRPAGELPLVVPGTLDGTALDAALARDGQWQGEVVVLDRDRREFPAALTVALLHDADGAPAGRIGTLVDLSQQVAHHRDLEAARDYLHTVTEHVADGLLVLDGRGTVTYANRAARRLLGDGGPLIGRPGRDIVRRADGDRTPDMLATGATAGTDRLRAARGRPLDVEWTTAAFERPATVPGRGRADREDSRVVVFRDVTERRAREERLRREAEGLRWEKRLGAALREGRFELHAQPIVSAATGDVVDHELLLRLRDEDGAFVLPGEFLPAAEGHGFITELDRWVAQQAVDVAAGGCAVHFNLSARSIGDVDLLVALRRRLERTGADPARLTVELTETALLGDRARAAAFAGHMRRIGCRVALDDFGAGYNSFARVKTMPADTIKIDRQFVADLLEQPASESVIKAIVAFAADLDLQVVAEGVEDAATARRLTELGVPLLQGYLYGRPRPLDRP